MSEAQRDECEVCGIDKPDTMPRAGQFDGMKVCRNCVQKIQQEAESNNTLKIRPIIDRLKGKQREPYQFDLDEILND